MIDSRTLRKAVVDNRIGRNESCKARMISDKTYVNLTGDHGHQSIIHKIISESNAMINHRQVTKIKVKFAFDTTNYDIDSNLT